jgi:hypothetical protein
MKSVYTSLDESPRLRELIKWLSNTLAAQRGLPIMTAVGLTVLSLIVHLLWIATNNVWIGVIGFLLLHIAIITALLGILLAEPLGRGN